MRSLKSRIMNVVLRAFGAKKMFADFHANVDSAEGFKVAVEKVRAKGQFSDRVPEKLVTAYTSEQINVSGFGLSLIEVGSQEKVIFFLHGGAYVLGIGDAHWSMMEKIGKLADCHVAVFDYPLAPEYKADEALDWSQEAFEILVKRYGAENVVLMGGSAGAGLAMGLSLKLQSEGRPQPSRIMLLYPWLDVTMSHPEARGLEKKNLILGVDGLIACGKHYAGDLGVEHPYVSPWFGELAGLPPVHVFTGSCDVLHPEGRDFVEKVRSAGGEASLSVYPEMQHGWLLFGIPESEKGIAEICAVLQG